jgi:hypothetical protein
MLDCLLPYDLGYRVIQNASPLLSVSDSLTLFELQGNVPLSKALIALRPTFTLWHIIKKNLQKYILHRDEWCQIL